MDAEIKKCQAASKPGELIPKSAFGRVVRDTLTKSNEERRSMTEVVAGQVVQQTEEVKISSEALLLLQEASEESF